MAYIRYEAALPKLKAAVQAGGGAVSHNDLLAALEANGDGDAMQHVRAAVKRNDLSAELVAQPGTRAVLLYSVPGAVPSAPTPPAPAPVPGQ